MKNSKLVPITRNSKFFSEEDFLFEENLGREAIEGDLNFKLILYQVNRDTTESDNLYGEASTNGIRFSPPTEILVVPILAEPENKSYNPNGSARYIQNGQLTFGIYDAQLVEEKIDINYGDYIGYPVNESEIIFFSVSHDGKKNFDNKHTIMGYKSAFRTIKCAAVDKSEFSAI